MSTSRFVPIPLMDYVQKHFAANPGTDRQDLIRRLRHALEASRSGERCTCGNRIWVIGSAEVGRMCFTCITGEAVSNRDYELAEALGLREVEG